MMQSRNTIQRALVLEAVRAMHNHPSAEEIYRHIAQSHPHVSRATVYRNLALLAERGEIRRVSHLDAADRFDFELGPHHHFRCRKCGGVFDAKLPYVENLLEAVGGEDGFVYQSYDITFEGLCPVCAEGT